MEKNDSKKCQKCKNFKEAYKQGVIDERVQWKVELRKLLNLYDDENWVNKKYIMRLFEKGRIER